MKGMFKRALAGVAAAALAVTGLALGAGAANAVEPAPVTDPVTFTFTATEAAQFNGRDSLTYYKLADYMKYTNGTHTVYGVQTAAGVTRDQISVALSAAGVQDVPSTGDLMAWVAQSGALDNDQSVNKPWTEGATRKFANKLAETLSGGATVQLQTTDDNPLEKTVSLPAGVYLFVDGNGASGSTGASKAMIVYSGTVDGGKLTDPVKGANTINLKNEITTIAKTVDPGVPAIGDTKSYTITTKVPNWNGKDLTAENTKFTITDKPSRGQTVNFGSLKVYVNGTELQKSVYETTGTDAFETVTGDLIADGTSTFTINLTDYMKTAALNKDLIGEEVKVTYTTVINGDALKNPVSNAAEVNNADSKAEDTTEGETVSQPTQFEFTKTEADGKTPLPGATFTITRDIDGDGTEAQPKDLKVRQEAEGVYVVDPNGSAVVTSGADGKVVIKGVGSGTYVVTEEDAPEGFSDTFLPSFTVKVTAEGTTAKVEYSDPGDSWGLVTTESRVVVRNVRNVTELPLTGAAGTMLFTVLGLLIAGAGALVYMKSRSVKHMLRG